MTTRTYTYPTLSSAMYAAVEAENEGYYAVIEHDEYVPQYYNVVIASTFEELDLFPEGE